ncbi:ankyrin repeat domain-containing protein 50 [Microdochium nivale]|nr:ankyrin repeat domain-containing protein 50 [Microdochium nivale]
MEALAALSLACNVLQLVGISLKISKALKTIRAENEPDKSAQSYAAALRQYGHEVTQSLATHGSSTNASLCVRAADVVAVGNELEKLLVRYTIGRKGKIRDMFSYGWKQGDIKALEQRLQQTQDLLQNEILKDVWQKVDTQWATIQVELPSLKYELKTLILELQQGNNNVLDIIAKQDATLQALDSIRIDTLHIKENFDRQKLQGRLDAELKEFLASLYFPSMNARRNMSSIVASEVTFRWVLDTPDAETTTDDVTTNRQRTARKLRLWLQDPTQRIFWISGKPGSGKSTLMHHLTGMPETVHAATGARHGASPVMLSAFVWASGDDLQRSLKCLLCTLLLQLFGQNNKAAEAALHAQGSSLQMKKTTISDWSEAELRSTLGKAIRSLQGPVYIIIDGLDEIDSADGTPERLLDFIRSVSTHENVKLCVSSRPEVIFEQSLQHYPHFRLQELTWDDMAHYAREELVDDLGLMPESTEREHNPEAVISHLVRHAEGVFLWLQLVIRSLRTGITNEDSWELLWKRIYDLPVDLESLYKKLVQKLERENKSYREFAATVFALLLLDEQYCGPSLEMSEASSIALYLNKDLRRRLIEEEVDNLKEEFRSCVTRVCKQVRARCAGLVEAPSGSKITLRTRVSFAHRTVRDFMLESGSGLWAQAGPPDWTACLDVTHARRRCLGPMRITPLGGLWVPPAAFRQPDMNLLEWAHFIRKGLPGEPREATLDHLARAMVAKGIWSRDERNPCVLALYDIPRWDEFLPPRHWLETWAPTGMSSVDFADHLLRGLLAPPKRTLLAALSWLCDNGATPCRRELRQWPGTNWPSALALAIGAAKWCAPALQTMMRLDVNLEEQVTVLWTREGGMFAFNRHTTSLLVGAAVRRNETSYLPLIQIRIPAFLRLALGSIELDDFGPGDESYRDRVDVAEEILRYHSTMESSIHLLGFVRAERGPRYEREAVLTIGGSYKLERILKLPPSSPTLAAALQALDGFYAEIEAIMQDSMQHNSLPQMDGQGTIDWLAASGFAEDRRDQHYLYHVRKGLEDDDCYIPCNEEYFISQGASDDDIT